MSLLSDLHGVKKMTKVSKNFEKSQTIFLCNFLLWICQCASLISFLFVPLFIYSLSCVQSDDFIGPVQEEVDAVQV